MSVSAQVLYTSGRDSRAWAAAHAQGDAPGRMPYGLNRLEDHDVAVSTRRWRRPTLPAKVVDRLGGGFEWVEELRSGRDEHPDISLSWSESCGVPAATRRVRSPVATGVIWITEPDANPPAHMRRFVSAGLDRAEAVWALSTAQLPVLEERFGLHRNRCHFLPFGIDCDFWSAARAPQPGLAVSVGNDRHRDHRNLLLAMSDVRTQSAGSSLEIVTSQHLTALAPEDHQHLHMTHKALRGLYSRASVAVVSTTFNLHVSGMTAMLEAASMGVPVVATATPGMEDYLVDGETGLLVEAGNPQALGKAVASLLTDPDRAQAMGEAAKTYVRKFHSEESQAAHLWKIMTTALALG